MKLHTFAILKLTFIFSNGKRSFLDPNEFCGGSAVNT